MRPIIIALALLALASWLLMLAADAPHPVTLTWLAWVTGIVAAFVAALGMADEADDA